MFDAVFIQYCVANNINIPNGMAMDVVDKQSHLDKFSTNEPAKFNKLCNDKDITIKSEQFIIRILLLLMVSSLVLMLRKLLHGLKILLIVLLLVLIKINLKTFDYEHWGDARDVQRTGTTDGYADRSCYSHGRYRYLS